MVNKKKFFFKNRVKCFFTEPGKVGKNRIKEDEGNPGIEEISDQWRKDHQHLENPPEDEDQS